MLMRLAARPVNVYSVCLLLLAVAWSISPAGAASLPPVATATATVDVQVRAGFDGFYKAGGWLPITALARNDGPAINGSLNLAAGTPAALAGKYSVAAILPTHSQKRLSFAAPAPAATNNRTVTLTEDGRTLVTQSAPVTAISPHDYLYGIISPTQDALDGMRGVRQFDGTVSVAHLALDDIPVAGPALNDVDVLVIDNTATSALSAAQRSLLTAWVGSGGQLVLGGGTGASETLAGLADIAPVTLTGTAVIDVGAALATWTHQTGAESTTVAMSRPVTGSTVRLQAGGVPLVVDRSLGQGWVTFLAVPAGTPALHDVPGGALAWQHILTGSRHVLDGQQVSQQGGSFSPSSAVYALPQTVLPSGSLLAWLIFGYIAGVGPLNYLVLRGLHRRELLWLTIPLISVLFAGGAYLLAGEIKGSDIVLNTVTIARHSRETAATATTTVEGAVGIFSPGRSTYSIRIGGGLGVSALDSTTNGTRSSELTVVSNGPSSLVEDIRVQKWSMQAFAVHGSTTSTRSPVATSLTLTGNTVSGWLRNTSAGVLQDVVLVIGGDTASVADMSPGEQRTVRLVLSGAVAPVGGIPSRPPPTLSGSNTSVARSRQALLAAAMDSALQGNSEAGAVGGPQVFAFSASAPFSVDVLGQHVQEHDTTLHVLPAAVNIASSPGSLPFGFAQRSLLQNSGVTNQFGGPWLPLGSTAVFQFQAPAPVGSVRWTALHVRLNLTNYGQAVPTAAASSTSVALYNWDAGTWDVQAGFTQGILTVQQVARYVDQRGLIRLQITGGNGREQVQTLDVALDGGTP
jgi:hypothetical protein